MILEENEGNGYEESEWMCCSTIRKGDEERENKWDFEGVFFC